MIPQSVRVRGDRSSKSPKKNAKDVQTAKSSIAWRTNDSTKMERRMSSSVLGERGLHSSFGPRTSTLARNGDHPKQSDTVGHQDSQLTQQTHERDQLRALDRHSRSDMKKAKSLVKKMSKRASSNANLSNSRITDSYNQNLINSNLSKRLPLSFLVQNQMRVLNTRSELARSNVFRSQGQAPAGPQAYNSTSGSDLNLFESSQAQGSEQQI